MIKKNLPVIELSINPDNDSFVSAVSLVEYPAIESDFFAFSGKQELQNFAADNEMKELIGLAMIPDQYIYRNSPQTGEYAAVFSKETIREVSQVFARKGLFNATNIEHSIIPADSYIFQSYIVDSAKGISAPKGLEKGVDGSWVIGVKVLSDSVWSDIKSGKIKGFSVEGIFGLLDTKSTVNLSKEALMFAEIEQLEQLMNIIKTI